jgi:hypothetical protein
MDPEDGSVDVPMYILSVDASSQAYISVHQQDVRSVGAKPYIDIGVSVLQVSEYIVFI